MDLRWPASRAEIAVIQSERKRIAFERAKKAPFYQGRLDGIDPSRLDDPEIWAKNSTTEQRRPSQDRAKEFSGKVLHPTADRSGRILALGRVHRATFVLSSFG